MQEHLAPHGHDFRKLSPVKSTFSPREQQASHVLRRLMRRLPSLSSSAVVVCQSLSLSLCLRCPDSLSVRVCPSRYVCAVRIPRVVIHSCDSLFASAPSNPHPLNPHSTSPSSIHIFNNVMCSLFSSREVRDMPGKKGEGEREGKRRRAKAGKKAFKQDKGDESSAISFEVSAISLPGARGFRRAVVAKWRKFSSAAHLRILPHWQKSHAQCTLHPA